MCVSIVLYSFISGFENFVVLLHCHMVKFAILIFRMGWAGGFLTCWVAVMGVSRPVSRVDFAGLVLVSGLEILVKMLLYEK